MPKYVAVALLCLWLATTFTVGVFLLTRVNVRSTGRSDRRKLAPQTCPSPGFYGTNGWVGRIMSAMKNAPKANGATTSMVSVT